MGCSLPLLLLLSLTLATSYPIPSRTRRDVVQFRTSIDTLGDDLVIPYSNVVLPGGFDGREKRGCPCGCGCPNCRCCSSRGGCSCCSCRNRETGNGVEEAICPCGCGRKGCKCCCCNCNRRDNNGGGGCPCYCGQRGGRCNCSDIDSNTIDGEDCPCCRNSSQRITDCGCGRGINCPFNKSRFRSGRPRIGQRMNGRYGSRRNYEEFNGRGKRNAWFEHPFLLNLFR